LWGGGCLELCYDDICCCLCKCKTCCTPLNTQVPKQTPTGPPGPVSEEMNK
jgi:hypothetical protein